MLSRPRAEDVTIFTGDLALLLRTGARINDALELLATDADIGRMRPDDRRARRFGSFRRELRRGARPPSRGFPARLCRAGPGRRGFRRAGPDSGGAERGAPARRGAEAPPHRRVALSRVPVARRGRRAAVLPHSSCCRNSPTCFAISTPSWTPSLAAFLGAVRVSCAPTARRSPPASLGLILATWLALRCAGSGARAPSSAIVARLPLVRPASWTTAVRACSAATSACCCRAA